MLEKQKHVGKRPGLFQLADAHLQRECPAEVEQARQAYCVTGLPGSFP
jgi:hypothetical protein